MEQRLVRVGVRVRVLGLGLGPGLGLEFGLGLGFEGRSSAVIGPQASSSSSLGQRGSMV